MTGRVWIGQGNGGTENMSRSTYFVQECPTCGRGLQVRVEYLGRQVVCQHCHGRFEACDPAGTAPSASNSGIDLLRRADELLVESTRVPPPRGVAYERNLSRSPKYSG
jgi:hypothetical protein